MSTLSMTHHATRKAARRRLEYARALIEKGWARNTFARDAKNRRVDVGDPEAARFCALGACQRAILDVDGADFEESRYYDLMTDALSAVSSSKRRGSRSIVTLNDSSSRKDPVLRAFDRAIEVLS